MTTLYPNKVQVETFLGCNARCTMCTIHDWSRPHGAMDNEVYTRVVGEAAAFKDKIGLFSLYMDGEPLMDNLLEERVAEAKSAGISNIGFATNGSLLTEERSRKLLEAGLDWLCISIDSLDKETYENIRVRLKLDTVLANVLSHIRQRDETNSASRVLIRFGDQPANAGQFESFYKFWSEKLTSKRDEIQHNALHNWGHGTEAGSFGATPCDYVFENCVILRDGTVPLCCVDYNAEVGFGNVMETPLLEIWNSPEFNRVRDLHRDGRRAEMPLCGNCDIPEVTLEPKAAKAS